MVAPAAPGRAGKNGMFFSFDALDELHRPAFVIPLVCHGLTAHERYEVTTLLVYTAAGPEPRTPAKRCIYMYSTTSRQVFFFGISYSTALKAPQAAVFLFVSFNPIRRRTGGT